MYSNYIKLFIFVYDYLLTQIRDAKSIYKNILQSCFHQYDNDNIVKKWDLWGSFIVYVTLSM
ncbi:hypothetical protein, variant 2 [Plasmodium yoelii 17X]|uniref:Uncharacterized protein n=1 Tax=Plasmodium yoelii 17X TaxID=1323249 RepID=V7PF93_PLAYE|nr:hypothetical protein, variant 1 [Plasmodium yoelii 17X]ETB57437.1 hypothetical protein, variant 2 [Plasmodium yoelii 17X]